MIQIVKVVNKENFMNKQKYIPSKTIIESFYPTYYFNLEEFSELTREEVINKLCLDFKEQLESSIDNNAFNFYYNYTEDNFYFYIPNINYSKQLDQSQYEVKQNINRCSASIEELELSKTLEQLKTERINELNAFMEIQDELSKLQENLNENE